MLLVAQQLWSRWTCIHTHAKYTHVCSCWCRHGAGGTVPGFPRRTTEGIQAQQGGARDTSPRDGENMHRIHAVNTHEPMCTLTHTHAHTGKYTHVCSLTYAYMHTFVLGRWQAWLQSNTLQGAGQLAKMRTAKETMLQQAFHLPCRVCKRMTDLKWMTGGCLRRCDDCCLSSKSWAGLSTPSPSPLFLSLLEAVVERGEEGRAGVNNRVLSWLHSNLETVCACVCACV